MTDEKVTVEIWKKIVDVQQHFNDLELRIRNFALIVTGAFLAFGASAIKETASIGLFGREVSVGGLIVFTAILPLAAFYFMDKYWYHRLLEGAVKAGAPIEQHLKELGYTVELGSMVSAASPITNWIYGKKEPGTGILLFPRRKMHSRHKMDVFYGILLISLVAAGLAIGLGVTPKPSETLDRPAVQATS